MCDDRGLSASERIGDRHQYVVAPPNIFWPRNTVGETAEVVGAAPGGDSGKSDWSRGT